MKPREKGGVVDANLNVYGVRGLKVAGVSLVVNSCNKSRQEDYTHADLMQICLSPLGMSQL